jgi:hypothetical protein
MRVVLRFSRGILIFVALLGARLMTDERCKVLLHTLLIHELQIPVCRTTMVLLALQPLMTLNCFGCKENDHEITADFGIRGCLHFVCGSVDLPSERGSALLVKTPYSGTMPVLPKERAPSEGFISSHP